MNIVTRLKFSPFIIGATLAVLFTAKSHALIKFNDGRNEIFVSGNTSFGYDSNFGANALDQEDYFTSLGLDIDFMRNAGIIGVNANLGWDITRYSNFSDQNFINPHGNLELTKGRGRTTGSLTMSAKRLSRSESVINIRANSWNYDAGLNIKYPVIDRYTISGKFGYEQTNYKDNSILFDIESLTAAADLFYVYNSARDLLFGYRYRNTKTSSNSIDYDHALTAGVTGKILAKLNGTARIGYQLRTTENRLNATDHSSLTASASTTWTISRRLTLTGRLGRDFTTLASDSSVETTSAGLDSQYALNSRLSVSGGVGYTHNRFLDVAIPRRDTAISINTGISYRKSDRFKIALTYGYLINWSTLNFSDYDRHSLTISVSSRW